MRARAVQATVLDALFGAAEALSRPPPLTSLVGVAWTLIGLPIGIQGGIDVLLGRWNSGHLLGGMVSLGVGM
jgi:hypothetical protein